jgi:hypothetical protein
VATYHNTTWHHNPENLNINSMVIPGMIPLNMMQELHNFHSLLTSLNGSENKNPWKPIYSSNVTATNVCFVCCMYSLNSAPLAKNE